MSIARRRRIGIVFVPPFLDTVPSLCNAAILLARQGYLVDIYTKSHPRFTSAVFEEPQIKLRILGSHDLPEIAHNAPAATVYADRQLFFDLVKRYKHTFGSVWTVLTTCYRGMFSILRLCRRQYLSVSQKWEKLRHAAEAVWLHINTPYLCFICVDPEGLVEAEVVTRFLRVPKIYYSLELLLRKEITSPREANLKQHEMILSRQAYFVVAQDQERAELLAQENQIPLDKFFLVPNAPLGPSRRKPSRYWHRKLGLSSQKRVVLNAGSLGQWTGVEEIVKSVRYWPENWVLVVHVRYNPEGLEDLERLTEVADRNRTFFSLSPVGRQEYEELVDGADLGIAFYVPTIGSTYTQTNIKSVGLSSGKIAYYLRAGLPVIVNQEASISRLLESYGTGITVKRADDIGGAISRISVNYDEYAKKACHFFDEYLDFSHPFQRVVHQIGRLTEATYD